MKKFNLVGSIILLVVSAVMLFIQPGMTSIVYGVIGLVGCMEATE